METQNPHPQIEALRAGWEESVRSTIAIGRSLNEEQWCMPSPCPGWRLKDLISHLIGIEEILLDPDRDVTESVSEKPWIKNSFGQFNEVAVDLRRDRLGTEILTEFENVVDVRNSAWKVDTRTPDLDVFFAPVGQVQLGLLLWRRVFDAWAHNQDLRMPLGLSGDLDGTAATLVYRQVTQLLPVTFAKKCAAPIGSSIAITVSGPGGFNYGAMVNDQGRGEFIKTPVVNPTVSIKMSTHDWYLLACGREGRENAAVAIEGDQELATRVLANFTITP
ncbi:hypothetical protein GALL_464850 [mine drainage metagenome]|uniref:Mycothiol-dependent maleylpyruvate isomerase metal-binding domain-containing protein n=1 Tax=mine drainage metagenome TaxID=410659 RepID=A0A1J5PVR9_9ZZZZ